MVLSYEVQSPADLLELILACLKNVTCVVVMG